MTPFPLTRQPFPFFLLSSFCILFTPPAFAVPNLGGTTGLIKIPTAEVVPEGHLEFAFGWIGGPRGFIRRPDTNRVYSANVGILPHLELTLRINQVMGWNDPEVFITDAADRMVSAKYQIPLPQGFPVLAVGMNDLFSANAFAKGNQKHEATQYGQHTKYLVMSKGFGSLGLHLGYAQSQSFINGLFAGLDYSPYRWLSLLGEYDSSEINLGLRLQPVNWFSVGAYELGRQDVAYFTSIDIPL